MALSEKAAVIIIGITFLLMAVFVPWPESWTWYEELMARLLVLTISVGSFAYLAVNRSR